MSRQFGTIAKVWIMLGLGILIQCGNSPTTAENRTELNSQSLPEKQTTSAPKTKITSIPTTSIMLETAAQPLPLRPGGLRFQLDQNQGQKFSYFKPIGDAKFGPDGHLYLCFPTKHAVVRFSQPDYDLTFFGQEQAGGRNQPIAHPDRLAFWQGRIFVTNTQKGQVMVFDNEFTLDTLLQIHIQDPICGPNNQFLIRSDQRPEVFFRADQKNQVNHQYMVPIDRTRPKEGQRLRFNILPNWDIVAATSSATDLFHLREDGSIKRHFTLKFGGPFDAEKMQLHSLQLDGDAYWLLLSEIGHQGQTNYLMAITLDNEVRFSWRLPFPCDGFHISPDRIVLFDREGGKAQVFFR